MRTVKSLTEELQKFPADAMCYAYQGEINAVVINGDKSVHCNYVQGWIHCREGVLPEDEEGTKLLAPVERNP